MPDLSKLTKRERENYHYMADALRRLEYDLHNTIEETNKIPRGWHSIAEQRYSRRMVKVTIRVEENVLRFFKSMGTGHGSRMNDVLAAWMYGRLSGVIRGSETMDYFKERKHAHDGARPAWGDTEREIESWSREEAAGDA